MGSDQANLETAGMLDDPAVEGRAIKCISMLLPKLPDHHRYKVIFMTRPIEEVIASQEKMKTRLGTTGATLEPEQLERGLHAHREETLKWLRQAPHIDLMEVEYPAFVRDPQSIVPQLVEFLGKVRLTNPENMAGVVDPALYRRKQADQVRELKPPD